MTLLFRKCFFFLLFLACGAVARTQAIHRTTENLVIITMDGMRWQEIYGGIDPVLMANKSFTKEPDDLKKRFWGGDARERRTKLFPFFWTKIAAKGQLYGNRDIGNRVNVTNPYQFSYPGYNEIFTGYPDTAINSNDKIRNKNRNVLEFLNGQKGFTGKVAVFSSWDAFPFILNDKRSGIYVNSDVDTLRFAGKELQVVNQMQFLSSRPLGMRPDLLTYFAAREYLKAYMPRVLYIAWDETDDWAHAGQYDQYLNSAHAEDGMIGDLWNTLQSIPQYRDKTTLIITCDHGRGDKIKEQWKDHGTNVEDSGGIWLAVMGPDTPTAGEVSVKAQLYQKQWAPTIAALLGFDFKPDHGQAEIVKTLLR
jgi:hypothetical protein